MVERTNVGMRYARHDADFNSRFRDGLRDALDPLRFASLHHPATAVEKTSALIKPLPERPATFHNHLLRRGSIPKETLHELFNCPLRFHRDQSAANSQTVKELKP